VTAVTLLGLPAAVGGASGAAAAPADGPVKKPKVVFEVSTVPAHPVAGKAFLYKVKVKNVGQVPSGKVTLNQPFPKGVKILKMPRECKSAAKPDQSVVVTCVWKNIPYKKSATATLGLFPDSSLSSGSLVIGQPTVTYKGGKKAKPAKGTSGKPGLQFTLSRESDLVLSARSGGAHALDIEPGGVATVTADVLNRGPSVADDIELSGTLPDGFSLVGAELTSVEPGNVSPERSARVAPERSTRRAKPVCEVEGHKLRCVIGKLKPGEHRWVRITLRAAPDAKPGKHTLELKLTSASKDPKGGDNVITVPIRVLARDSTRATAATVGGHSAGGTTTASSDNSRGQERSVVGYIKKSALAGFANSFGVAGLINTAGVASIVPPPAPQPPPPAPATVAPVPPPPPPPPPPAPKKITPIRDVHKAKASSGGAKQIPLLLLMGTFVVTAIAGAVRGGGDAGGGEGSGAGARESGRFGWRIPWPIAGYRAVCGVVILTEELYGMLLGLGQPDFSVLDYLSSFAFLTGTLAAIVLLVGVVRQVPARVRGGTVLAMATTAVVFLTMPAPVGPSAPVGWLLQVVVPAIVLLDWLIDAPAGRMRGRAARGWAVIALSYLAYSMLRGPFADWYPYPFLDPGLVGGYVRVAAYCLGLGLAMAVISQLIVWSGGRFTSRTQPEPREATLPRPVG